MKTIMFRARTALLLACFSLTAATHAADDLQAAFDQGRAAYYAGNFPLARKLLSKVLAVQPNHYQTRAMLATIAAQDKQEQPTLKDLYAAVRIPKFEIADATLEESLQALSLMTKNHSGGKVTPNFVVKNADLNKALVTLTLTNTPVDQIVRYLADLAKAKVSWEQHAVVFAGLTD
jgi:hypothetical protein